jgi:hypothetical protein
MRITELPASMSLTVWVANGLGAGLFIAGVVIVGAFVLLMGMAKLEPPPRPPHQHRGPETRRSLP